jgi:hypothetical protein
MAVTPASGHEPQDVPPRQDTGVPVASPSVGALAAIVRIVLAAAFRIGSWCFYDVRTSGLENDPGLPQTYFALAHKRDDDPILLLPEVLAHRGWRGLAGDVHFALRGDAFTPGFLARLVPRPTWFAWLVHRLALGPVLRRLGIHPIDGMRRPAVEWLRSTLATLGDIPAGEALEASHLRSLAQATGEDEAALASQTLSRLLTWRYTKHLAYLSGPNMLAGQTRHETERRVFALASAQVRALGALLWQGRSVLGAPEGQLSPDGRLGSTTASLRRLMNAAPPGTCVVPLTIAYDFMTTWRPAVFVEVAPPILDAQPLPAPRLARAVHDAWLRSLRCTCTQLASGFLVWAARTGQPEFSSRELGTAITELAVWLALNGRHVDPRLLRPPATRMLVRRYLASAERHGLVRRLGSDRWLATPGSTRLQVAMGEVGFRTQPLAYAWNELASWLALQTAELRTRLPPTTSSRTAALIDWLCAHADGDTLD